MRTEDQDNRTVYCGNLSEDVTEAILYELFLQAGPVENVSRPKDPSGRPKPFAFILYTFECSVPYALELFKGTKLFNRTLNMNSRSQLQHVPVLDTHLSEFTEGDYIQDDTRHHGREHRRSIGGSNHHRSSNRESDENEPKSWAELNALRGKGSLSQSHVRDDLQVSPDNRRDSNSASRTELPDFNLLLQMGQQLMFPGNMGVPGMMAMNGMLSMPAMMPFMGGNTIYPSMQGRMSGGDRNSPDRDRRRRDRHEEQGRRRDRHQECNRRDHPYSDRHPSDHRDDRSHDRGYSSSRSSHDRERRDRRSR